MLALAQAGCDFRATNGMGHSGLSQAAAYGNFATLRAMLHVGADVAQYTAGKHMGALFRACYNGHVSCARALIEHKADVNVVLADGTGCCYVAAEKNHCDVLQLLIQSCAAFDSPDNNGVTPLWRAAERGCGESIRFLIDACANVDVVLSVVDQQPAAALTFNVTILIDEHTGLSCGSFSQYCVEPAVHIPGFERPCPTCGCF